MNERKLAELLPDKKLYLCYSIDHIMNIRETVGQSKKLNGNPGKTENLSCELRGRNIEWSKRICTECSSFKR